MIIALGHKKRRGKDTVASFMCKYHKFTRASFAENLKRGTCNFFGWSDPEESKEERDPYWGISKRQAFRDFGMFAREKYGDKFWVKSMAQGIDLNSDIVITDLRMPVGEAEWVRSVGGYTVRIDRDGVHGDDSHPTEIEMDSYPYDYAIKNDGTLYDLLVKTRDMVDFFTEREKERKKGNK